LNAANRRDGDRPMVDRTTFCDVSDGLSNTIAVGEIAGRPDIYERGTLDDVGRIGAIMQPNWATSRPFSANVLRKDLGVNQTNRGDFTVFTNLAPMWASRTARFIC
jgi:hypothetical protein